MFSFRRLALLLALSIAAAQFALAQDSTQDSTSTSNPASTQQQQDQAKQPANQGTVSVQQRIRERREKRRAAAIHDVYSHLYEIGMGMGYLRFAPGPGVPPGPALQRVTMYAWDANITRFYNQRLGVTIDGRGNYGTAFVGLNQFSLTRPSISTYSVMGGPTYRFYLQPRYSIGGRVMAGYAMGDFSGDTNGFGPKALGLYPDGSTFAASASLIGDYNVTPAIALRLAPEYYASGFGSSLQNSLGFTAGFVFRFGKQ